jgi:hypothetical protein
VKIAVAGIGYVGFSNAILLAQNHEVDALDLNPEKVVLLNAKQSPISDSQVSDYLANKPLNLRATLDAIIAFEGADLVIVATPTDYDPDSNYFNTRSVEAVVKQIQALNPQALIVIKRPCPSAIPKKSPGNLKLRTSFSCLNSCGKAMHFTTTCIRRESSLVTRAAEARPLPIYYWKARSGKMHLYCSPDQVKLRPSSRSIADPVDLF